MVALRTNILLCIHLEGNCQNSMFIFSVLFKAKQVLVIMVGLLLPYTATIRNNILVKLWECVTNGSGMRLHGATWSEASRKWTRTPFCTYSYVVFQELIFSINVLFPVPDEPPEPVAMDDGNTVIAHLESRAKLFTQNHVNRFFEFKSHQSSTTDCRQRCYEYSCFAFIVQSDTVCQVAKDAFTITPTDADNYLMVRSYMEFLRYPLDEPDPILPVEGKLCHQIFLRQDSFQLR